MTRISGTKHECDECGKITVISNGPRMFLYNYTQRSLCAGCYAKLPEDKRQHIEKGERFVLCLSLEGLAASFGDTSKLSRKITDEEQALIKEFNMEKLCDCGCGKTQVMIKVGNVR